LKFKPEPQVQGSLRPGFFLADFLTGSLVL
jgi:hypothetical protein